MMQPYTGHQMVVLERRNSRGGLDFTGLQPPVDSLTFDELYKLMFRDNALATGSWDCLRSWLSDKGWSIRAKTW